MVPIGKVTDFIKGCVWYLCCQQPEKRFTCLLVVLRIDSHEIECSECVSIVTISNGRIVTVILVSG